MCSYVVVAVEIVFYENFFFSGSSSQLTCDPLEIYVSNFETEFLDRTRQFYKRESSELLGKLSVAEYTIKAEIRFDEEMKRVGVSCPKKTFCCDFEKINFNFIFEILMKKYDKFI